MAVAAAADGWASGPKLWKGVLRGAFGGVGVGLIPFASEWALQLAQQQARMSLLHVSWVPLQPHSGWFFSSVHL